MCGWLTQSCAQLPNKLSLTLTRENVLKRWVSGEMLFGNEVIIIDGDFFLAL